MNDDKLDNEIFKNQTVKEFHVLTHALLCPCVPILLWLQPQCPTCPSWSPTPTHLICFPTTANWMALCYPWHEFDWLRLPTTVSQKWSIDQLNLHRSLIFTHRFLKNPCAIWEQMKDEPTLRVNKNVWTNVIADTVVVYFQKYVK